MMKPIPQEWVKRYVDLLLDAAKMFDSLSPMRASILLRADAVMDMVKAFRDTNVVPVDDNGWPTVRPEDMTEEMLQTMVHRWSACKDDVHTIGRLEYDKYVNELNKRLQT